MVSDDLLGLSSLAYHVRTTARGFLLESYLSLAMVATGLRPWEVQLYPIQVVPVLFRLVLSWTPTLSYILLLACLRRRGVG